MEALREAGMIHLNGDKGASCLIHLGTSHNVETCPMAEELLQGMMSRGHIEVCSAKKGEEDILVSCPSSTLYVEAAEESLETSFQALGIMSNAYVESPLA